MNFERLSVICFLNFKKHLKAPTILEGLDFKILQSDHGKKFKIAGERIRGGSKNFMRCHSSFKLKKNKFQTLKKQIQHFL